jgi:hypothetical protein
MNSYSGVIPLARELEYSAIYMHGFHANLTPKVGWACTCKVENPPHITRDKLSAHKVTKKRRYIVCTNSFLIIIYIYRGLKKTDPDTLVLESILCHPCVLFKIKYLNIIRWPTTLTFYFFDFKSYIILFLSFKKIN